MVVHNQFVTSRMRRCIRVENSFKFESSRAAFLTLRVCVSTPKFFASERLAGAIFVGASFRPPRFLQRGVFARRSLSHRAIAHAPPCESSPGRVNPARSH